MLLGMVNALFALAAFFLAQRALLRGWPFVKTGWLAIQTQAQHPDVRENVFRRMAASEGGRFFLGGIIWLLIGIGATLAGLYFMVQAYQGLYVGT